MAQSSCQYAGVLQIHPAEDDDQFDPDCPDECVDPKEHAGFSVVTFMGQLAVGAPGHGGLDPLGQPKSRGAVYIYTKIVSPPPPYAQPVAQLYGANDGDLFGASVSATATWLVVGAPGYSGAGAVYIYVRDDLAPCPVVFDQLIQAPHPTINPLFGRSVAISSSGDFIVVGAKEAAYAYRYNGTDWVPDIGPTVPPIEAKLLPDSPFENPDFGFAVSVNQDWALVGAPDEFDGNDVRVGAIYFFQREVSPIHGPQWKKKDKEMNPSPYASAGDRFGHSVSVLSPWAFVGAPLADIVVDVGPPPIVNTDQGAAYAFKNSGACTDGPWCLFDPVSGPPQLTGSDSNDSDNFGTAVALGRTGHVMIGAPYEEEALGGDGGPLTGRVYQFDVISLPAEDVVEVCLFLGSGLMGMDEEFGRAVSVDGDNFAIGAPLHDLGSTGVCPCYPAGPCPEDAGAVFVGQMP